MVCCGPVPQTVQDEILHHRVIAVNRIAAAAEVIVVSLRRQHVIDVIVKALEGNHGTVPVSLCRVVKHHVQDALDAVLMKLPDEFFQFMALVVVFLLRCIAGVRRKECYRIVSPVVEQLLSVMFSGALHLVKLKDRHEFNRIDPQFLEIGNLFHNAPEGARRTDAGGIVFCKPADMQLIDDQILRHKPGIPIPSPVKHGSDHSSLIESLIFRTPIALSRHGHGIDIQKGLFLFKPQSLFRIPGPVQTVGILKIFDIQAEDNHGPDLPDAAVLREGNSRIRPFFPRPVQQERYLRRGCRMDCEVHAAPHHMGAVGAEITGTHHKTAGFPGRNQDDIFSSGHPDVIDELCRILICHAFLLSDIAEYRLIIMG